MTWTGLWHLICQWNTHSIQYLAQRKCNQIFLNRWALTLGTVSLAFSSLTFTLFLSLSFYIGTSVIGMVLVWSTMWKRPLLWFAAKNIPPLRKLSLVNVLFFSLWPLSDIHTFTHLWSLVNVLRRDPAAEQKKEMTKYKSRKLKNGWVNFVDAFHTKFILIWDVSVFG